MAKAKPFSRSDAFSDLDKRSREGRLVQKTRAELVAHVGGNPNVVQRQLIDRIAWLTLRVAMCDRKAAEGTPLTVPEQVAYTSWNIALTRCLARLGTQPAAPAKAKTLAEHLAERAGQAA